MTTSSSVPRISTILVEIHLQFALFGCCCFIKVVWKYIYSRGPEWGHNVLLHDFEIDLLHVHLFCIFWWALDGPEDFLLLWVINVSTEAGELGRGGMGHTSTSGIVRECVV